MSENDQIQPWFQIETQVDLHVQQNNSAQEQKQIKDTSQQIIEQDSVKNVQQDLQPTTDNQVQETKKRPSWLTKILSGIYCLIWIALISLRICEIFQGSYGEYFSFRNIIISILIVWFWILFISVWILSYNTSDIDIYYHPSRLTKFLSGIYRFLWIALIRAGLWNFSLLSSEYASFTFWRVLYVGWSITLCWILYILLWRLLYKTKKWIPSIFLLISLVVNIMFFRILTKFTEHNYWYFSIASERLWFAIILLSVIYFLILAFVWLVKCYRFKKKWIINQKYLDSTPSKKKVWIITTIILLLIVILDLIYGKIQWSKIPEIDEAIFQRTEHQTKLPDEEDAIVQLRAFYDWNKGKIVDILDSYFLHELSTSNSYPEKNVDVSWKHHTNECIVFNSWWNEYCDTWAWNKKTLNRCLNNYYYLGNNWYYTKDFINSDWYLSIDWEKVTIFEYIHKNEPEIRAIFKELDRIVSLDYYLPNDEIFNLLPPYFQWFSRASMVVLQYYIFQKDRDMVIFIIKLNYKIADIFNSSWSLLNQLISMVIQGIVDSRVNSYIQLFPKNLREELSERYKTHIYDKDEIIDKMVKWEFVMWNRAKNGNIMWDVWKDVPSLFQFLFHFPFYSEEKINRLMVYSYYELWNWLKNNIKEPFLWDRMDNILSLYNLYNIFWKYPYHTLMPRMNSINNRINRNTFHKNALIKNLQSGKYDVWFGELDWDNLSDYERDSLKISND